MSLTRELRAVKLARRRLNKDQKPFHVMTVPRGTSDAQMAVIARNLRELEEHVGRPFIVVNEGITLT